MLVPEVAVKLRETAAWSPGATGTDPELKWVSPTLERSPWVLTIQAAMFCSGPVASSQV